MGTRRLSLGGYRRITFAALVALSAIVVSGGAVRVTGSGLGCSDWPNCHENQLVAPLEYHAMIEFINRVFTGVVSIAVVLAVLGSLWLDQRRRDLTWLSVGLVAGVLGQIVLGGLVVLTHLNPWLVLGHFALSMVLVANSVVLHHRAARVRSTEGYIADLDFERMTMARVVVIGALVVMATGMLVTGSGPHSGAHGNDLVERLPFSVHNVARVHGVTLVLFLAAVAGLALMLRHPRYTAARGDVTVVLGVAVAQGAIGYTQYFMGVPAGLVALHIAGATALWIAVVRFYIRRFEPVAIGAAAAETYRHVPEPEPR